MSLLTNPNGHTHIGKWEPSYSTSENRNLKKNFDSNFPIWLKMSEEHYALASQFATLP